MPRAKLRTPELRDHVLSVAVDLLARDGVAGFTARRIATEANTSTPAIYELFGDKSGLVREVFFEGFRLLRRQLDAVDRSDDPRADLLELLSRYRGFMRENPVLSDVMFSRPFTDFEPGPAELDASGSVRIFIVELVSRCIEAGVLRGDPTDVAHVLVALVQGLAAAENAGRLGTSIESVDRRWALAVKAAIDGLSGQRSKGAS
ncbi:MAG TPA: TetR/AcrR family transcriptional regulator [Solirubrobacteraceae bacterium]|nr:TetR/AcrR family transcriptional regulator [Solirubrobacteraceae bacterium]